MMGAPYIHRLIPLYSLRHNLFLEQTKIYHSLHKDGAYSFLLMTDNLRANQAFFNLYQEILECTDNFSCKLPVENEEFDHIYLLKII